MKKIILLFFIVNCFTLFGQKPPAKDSTEVCFPYNVGQQILLDLNDYDRVKEILVLTENEVDTLELKIKKQEGVIKFLESKDTTYKEIIGEKDEKFKIVDTENKTLRDDIHKLKTKNTIIEIVAGALIASLTYVQFFLQ
jgi:hypothetical protein